MTCDVSGADSSQYGETEFLRAYFAMHPPKYRRLVDIGAHGKWISNTWGLIQDGWQGLLVDANPERIPAIHREFAADDRIKVLNCAVGSAGGQALLRIHTEPGSSSILSSWGPQNETGVSYEVPLVSCVQLLHDENIPDDLDLFQVDAEGMDREIVENLLTGACRPRIISAEALTLRQGPGFLVLPGYRLLRDTWRPYGTVFYERLGDEHTVI